MYVGAVGNEPVNEGNISVGCSADDRLVKGDSCICPIIEEEKGDVDAVGRTGGTQECIVASLDMPSVVSYSHGDVLWRGGVRERAATSCNALDGEFERHAGFCCNGKVAERIVASHEVICTISHKSDDLIIKAVLTGKNNLVKVILYGLAIGMKEPLAKGTFLP